VPNNSIILQDGLGQVLDFAREIEKLPITNFSVVAIHIDQRKHVYGAFLLRLFGTHGFLTCTQSLKVFLPGSEVNLHDDRVYYIYTCYFLQNSFKWFFMFQMTEALECVGNCPCDEPRNWRNQNISLDNIVEVEIINFSGEVRDIDVLTLIFKWASMLKRMTVTLSPWIKQNNFEGCVADIDKIFLAFPSVNCSIL
jgi:hypothetical protein